MGEQVFSSLKKEKTDELKQQIFNVKINRTDEKYRNYDFFNKRVRYIKIYRLLLGKV